MNFRVYLRSRPGLVEQYAGHVDVRADGVEQAKERALAKLKRSAFPGRNAGMWTIEKVEAR